MSNTFFQVVYVHIYGRLVSAQWIKRLHVHLRPLEEMGYTYEAHCTQLCVKYFFEQIARFVSVSCVLLVVGD
jgi:hypothetical protein